MALWDGEKDMGEEKEMAVMKEGGGSGTQCLLFTLPSFSEPEVLEF